MQPTRAWRQLVRQERGAVMITTLFFLFCLCGLLSLLLFIEQTDLIKMKTQQTADLITKGARAAGTWAYVTGTGDVQKMLFETTEEASRRKANIIRGAREEAEILWKLNLPSLQEEDRRVTAVHQKGEQGSLYRQGIYHLRIFNQNRVHLLWETVLLSFERVSQSGIR